MATESGRPTDEPIYVIEIGRLEVVSLSVYGVVLTFLSLGAVTAVVDARSGSVASALVLLVAFVGTIIVHELVHGLFFALFGGSPSFGAGITYSLPYACATSPGDRFRPHQMYAIAAAPLVLVTAAAVAIGVLVPELAAVAVVVVVGNVSGAVGDLWMMTRMRAFTSRAEVTFEDTRTGLAVYSHDPEALVVAGELRAAKESTKHRYVVTALGATMVLMLIAIVVPGILTAVGTSSDVVIGPDWFSLIGYRPSADGLEIQISFLPSILGVRHLRVGLRPASDDAHRTVNLMGLRTGAGLVGLIGLEREIADILARNVDVVPVANLKAGPAFQALAESIPL